jgi:pimeloyl-ACP methyl ester carboxylesterase
MPLRRGKGSTGRNEDVVSVFCLIHGAWHDGSCWEPVVRRLEARGHRAVAPDLPLHDPKAGFEERARPALQALEGIEAPAVVVGHSAGSAYATLVAAARPGSVLVYLCARLNGFEPPPGAPAPFRAGFPFPANRPDGANVWDGEAAMSAMYSRLPPDTARALVRRLRPMTPTPGEYPLASHPMIPTALVYAAEDEFFDPAWERFIARELLGIDPIEIPGGHFPMAEDPDALTDLLVRLSAHDDLPARRPLG